MKTDPFIDFQKLIPDARTIVEIGHHDGRDTFKFLRYFPKCKVFAFDPDSRAQSLLFKQGEDKGLNFEELLGNRLFLFNIAVSNMNGKATFYLSNSQSRSHNNSDFWSASSSLRPPKAHLNLWPDISFNKEIEVDSIKLDTFSETLEAHFNIKEVDLIWIDANGADGDVINGGSKFINSNVKYVFVEFSNNELFEGQLSKKDLIGLLPHFKEVEVYNYFGNFGNVLLKNTGL